jgi:N utilization substance protein B
MGNRRAAREFALQMLYQWDLRRDNLDRSISTFWEVNKSDEDVRSFADRLVYGTVEHLDVIDPLIERHAKNWRLERMETLDRNLLRMAVQELLHERETPATVVIDEAIEIARRFSTWKSPQFINGLLDSIHKEIEEQRKS